jgi:hypothetical protein
MMRATKIGTACLLMSAFFLGCVEKEVKFSLRKRTPQEATLAALKSTNADDRYQGLSELGKSKALRADWAVKAMGVIARTDPCDSVRALAVHNFGRIGDARVWPALVEALSDPADGVRFEAAWGLSESCWTFSPENSAMTAEAEKNLLRALTSDRSVDVRLNSARALGQFKSRPVLTGLIAALKDHEFAVRYEAEQSLIRLTGQTFHGEPAAWLSWLEKADDPFADAGKTPLEMCEPKRNFLQRSRKSAHQFYEEWQGPAKTD